MMGFMSPIIFLALFFGGENSLSGYVNPEVYWEGRGVAYEVNALSAFLLEESGEADPDLIKQEIAKLGSADYAEREAASATLAGFGSPARSLLQAASRSRDPEVARRAKELLKKIEGDLGAHDPEEQWFALYSLSQMEDPAAKMVIQKVAQGPESDLKASAQKYLAQPAAGKVLSSAKDAVVGFPPDTRVIIQAQPWQGESEVLKRIHQSAEIQSKLIELLVKTGDIKVHRVSLAMNEGLFTRNQGKVLIRVEADYDIERMKSLLEKGHYREVGGNKSFFVYSRRTLTIVLSKDANLLFQLGFGEEESIDFGEFEKVLNGGGEPEFSKELFADYTQLAESSLIRGAGEFTGEMMQNLEDFSGVRRGQFQMDTDEGAQTVSLSIVTEEGEAATAFLKYAQEENDKIQELLRNENDEWVKPMLSLLETIEISGQAERVNVKASVGGDILLGTVDLVEKAMLQVREMRQRHEQQILLNHQGGGF